MLQWLLQVESVGIQDLYVTKLAAADHNKRRVRRDRDANDFHVLFQPQTLHNSLRAQIRNDEVSCVFGFNVTLVFLIVRVILRVVGTPVQLVFGVLLSSRDDKVGFVQEELGGRNIARVMLQPLKHRERFRHS